MRSFGQFREDATSRERKSIWKIYLKMAIKPVPVCVCVIKSSVTLLETDYSITTKAKESKHN